MEVLLLDWTAAGRGKQGRGGMSGVKKKKKMKSVLCRVGLMRRQLSSARLCEDKRSEHKCVSVSFVRVFAKEIARTRGGESEGDVISVGAVTATDRRMEGGDDSPDLRDLVESTVVSSVSLGRH